MFASSNISAAVKSLIAAAAVEGAGCGAFGLTRGKILVLFPEGERSIDGTVKKFKKGAPILAQHLGVPIVPVAILGARDAMRKGSLVIQPVTVRVRFGEPVETAGLTLDDRDALAATVRARIEALLAEA